MRRPVAGYRYVAILHAPNSPSGTLSPHHPNNPGGCVRSATEPQIVLVGATGESRASVKVRAARLLFDDSGEAADDGGNATGSAPAPSAMLHILTYSAVSLSYGSALREYEFLEREQAVREVMQQDAATRTGPPV